MKFKKVHFILFPKGIINKFPNNSLKPKNIPLTYIFDKPNL